MGKDIPCLFFDNEVAFDAAADPKDKRKLDEQAKLLVDFAKSGEPYRCAGIAQEYVLSKVDQTVAQERGCEVTRRLLQEFDGYANAMRSNNGHDSYYQYASIAEHQDTLVDKWINEVAEHGEHVYSLLDNFTAELKRKTEQAREDIFGAQFVQRQQGLLQQVCSSLDSSALSWQIRRCPFCRIIWWNEGSCHQRRCGHQGAPDWSHDVLAVPPRGRHQMRHGCGRKFEWPMAQPVSQEELKSALRPHIKQSECVSKREFSKRASDI